MIFLFPQWQGAGDESIYHLTKEVLDNAQFQTKTITLERHRMQASKPILNYSAIHNHALRFRNLLHQHHPAQVVTLGGDNSISFIPISYLQKKYENLKVIYIGELLNEPSIANDSKVYFENIFLDFLNKPSDIALEKLMFANLSEKSISTIKKGKALEGILADKKTKSSEHYYIHVDCNYCNDPIMIEQILRKFVFENSTVLGLAFAHVYALEERTFGIINDFLKDVSL